MGKYKMYSPKDAAQAALSKLVSKIPEMEENYRRSMDEFSMDPVAQQRYVAGVADWISIMRSPEIRNAISNAIQKAKEKLRRRIYGVTREKIGVPVR